MRNLNVRAYILVILFAAGLTAVVAIGIQQGWGAFRKPTKEQVINADAANQAALESGAVDLAAVDLFMQLIPPSASEEVRMLTLQLDGLNYYVRDDNPDVDVESVCVEAVDIILNPDESENSADFSFLQEPLCVTPLPEEFTAESSDLSGLTLDNFYSIAVGPDEPSKFDIKDPDLISLNFWYPYDSLTLKSAMFIAYSVTLTDGEVIVSTIRPYISWDIQTSGTRAWDVKFENQTVPLSKLGIPDFQDGTYESMTIILNRSLLYRLVFPFFLIGMVLLIGLVPLLGDKDTLVDICAAMLFGIFGIKGILGPGEQMGQTILDISLIGMYIVLAFAAVLFFINRIRARRGESEPAK